MSTVMRSQDRPDLSPHFNARLERILGPIEYRAIDQLHNYPGNPRKHPERQIVKLMASVRRFGVVLPILVDVHNTIIAGEAVLEALRRLGTPSVPVIVAEHLSQSEVRAYRLADNRLAELATWDEELLAIELKEIIELDEVEIDILGWETAEIDVMLSVASDAAGDDDPADVPLAPPKDPIARPGDLVQLGAHRLLCGSALDAASWDRLLEGDAGATMVFTDAPYNVPVNGHVRGSGGHAEFAMASGEMSEAEFTTFLGDALGAMAARVRDGGLLYLCMDWRHLPELLTAMRHHALTLINLCVWNKSNGGMGSLYRSKHELVLVAKKGKAAHVNNVQLGQHGRYRTNVWDYPGVNAFGASRTEDLADHPTVKPVALVADAIRDVTNPGDLVLDGFMGSGTTLLAAERTRRIARGTEIEPAYVDVAIRRFETLTGKAATLVETGETWAEVTQRRTGELEAHDHHEEAPPT